MNLLSSSSLIAIRLNSSPIVYLTGRVETHETTLHGRLYLVRILSLLAVLAAWIPFICSMLHFLWGGVQHLNIKTIWLRVDGISLLLAGSILILGTLVVLFSGSYMMEEVECHRWQALCPSGKSLLRAFKRKIVGFSR